jgi:hypothetical protein
MLFKKLQGIQIKPGDWRPVVSKDAGFAVDMPGEPAIEEKVETVAGAQLSMLSYSINVPQRYLFLVTFADLREHFGGVSPQVLLEGARDSVVTLEQGGLVSDGPISLGGIPGREFTIAGTEGMMRCRYYLKDPYLYSFRLRTTKEFAVSRDADRFFASIKLTGPAVSGPPLAPGWTEFTSVDGRFIVNMPGLPSRRQQNFSTKSGEMVLHIFSLDLGRLNEQFSVQYTDYPEQFLKEAQSADAVLKKASTVDAFNIGGSVVSEKALSLGRYSGREIQAENAELAMRIRLYLVDRRLYKVVATWPYLLGRRRTVPGVLPADAVGLGPRRGAAARQEHPLSPASGGPPGVGRALTNCWSSLSFTVE